MRKLVVPVAAVLLACGACVLLPADQAEPQSPQAKNATTAPSSQPVQRTVFAAPFDNETGQGQYDPAGAAMGDLVAVLLAKQPNIRVVERQRLLALAEEQALTLRGLTGRKYAVRAGKLLRADTVLVGRLYLMEDKMTVAVTVLDIDTERVVAAEQLSCRPTYLVEAALQLARRLGRQMSLPLPDIDPKDIDASPIASLHFAKGLSRFYTGNMDEAIMQFMRTMDLDPDYIEAHYWSGMAYYGLREHGHAIIEWEKFLDRYGDGPEADEVCGLLEHARELDSGSPVHRLTPATAPAPADE